jgi:hypothetical protein
METRSWVIKAVICLLGLANANPAIADESLTTNPPPKAISIAAIETTFAVDPKAKEVDPAYVEAVTVAYFSDIPKMVDICRCESGFQQYREDGTLNVNRLRSKKTKARLSSAAGVCQITYKGHYEEWSKSAETDITTLMGNLTYARQMYLEDGTSQWNESRRCWQSKKYK